MVKTITHRIKDVKGREVNTSCGVVLKFKTSEPFVGCSTWESDVTCTDCIKQRKKRRA